MTSSHKAIMGTSSVSCASHTDVRKQRENKGKDGKYVKWIIMAFSWRGYHEVGQLDWVARCPLSTDSTNLFVGGEMLASVSVIPDQKVGSEW